MMQEVIITPEERAQFNREHDVALQLFHHTIDISLQLDADPVGVTYSLWVILTRALVEAGWTTEQLLRNVGTHAADQESAGRA